MASQHTRSRNLRCSGFLIGVALAGFLDGILLHQILQWHSLLSSLEGERFRDLRFRMLTDGLFHAAMYLVALIGLGLLLARRREMATPGAARSLDAALLAGFGAWHVLDAVLNHWMLGLHRIRENAAEPLIWDLAFFALGIACLAAAWWIGRGRPGGGGRASRLAAAPVLAAGTVLVGVLAATPLIGSDRVTVVFRRDMPIPQIASAVAAVDGRMISARPEDGIWMIQLPESRMALRLYANGAVFVSGTVLGMGCFSASPTPET